MGSTDPRSTLEDHVIGSGVRGWLESPARDAAPSDCVFVSGWAFSSRSRIVGLWVDVGGERRPISYGLPRDDVASAYQDVPEAFNSGFSAYLELHDGNASRTTLRIRAAFDDGREMDLFTRTLATARWAQSPIAAALREAVARPRLLASPRAWRGAWSLARRAWAPAPARMPRDVSPTCDAASRAALANVLASRLRIKAPSANPPTVSVVIVVWNRADLTLGCLRALAGQTDVALETIVVDNASSDETPALLALVDGATVIRNGTNLGFTIAANIGARRASGEFLLFLNNDAELLPGAIGALVAAARRTPDIGAVGGKLVFPDGRLQEAGSIVWSDGSCDAYGRGGDPLAPEFGFERPVDFCSGALLLTPRRLFAELGGFDERYAPAYYEDADYCARLWARGCPVVYQPRAAAIHREFGSAVSRASSIALQRERRAMFASAHREWLQGQHPRDPDAVAARSHPHGASSVVFIDDAAPDPRLGAGFPRAAAMVRAFRELGYRVTIYTTNGGARPDVAALADVEIVAGGPESLRGFFAGRRAPDLVVVSRPHNMQYVKAAAGADLARLGAPCVYDAEAVFAFRDIGRRALIAMPAAAAEQRTLVDAEVALARACAAVLVVNDDERRVFADAGHAHVFVVSHAVGAAATPAPFERRQSILFVGAFSPASPNDDAVRYFCTEVLPLLRQSGCRAPVVIAGAHIPDALKAELDGAVAWHSDVDDLTDLYDDARVFVAPMRFGAGIPLKVVEAAARGVPVVSSSLAARQLGWHPGSELLTADAPAEFVRAVAWLFADRDSWIRVRERALARVERDYGPDRFRAAVHRALESVSV